jgi:hypothetical protein
MLNWPCDHYVCSLQLQSLAVASRMLAHCHLLLYKDLAPSMLHFIASQKNHENAGQSGLRQLCTCGTINLNCLLLRWTRDTMSEIDVASPSIVFGSCISFDLDDSLCRKRCRARPLPANSTPSNHLHVQVFREQSLARAILEIYLPILSCVC